ncbi:MAG: hypothetical protein KatS3mg115_1598 [Candidatus Poribacteria bacterium]|nr:MAG: hypothetical protein KatS3mg115_1598 [Candidatus Poribacteria bacterium]
MSLWLVCLSPGEAQVALRLFRPQELFRIGDVTVFTTAQPELTLVGEIRSPGGRVRLIVETPDGIPRPESPELPLRQWTVDLEQVYPLRELILLPVIIVGEGGTPRSYGPRNVFLRLSEDGRTFSDPLAFVASSGVEAPDRRVRLSLPEGLQARFLRIFWEDGWQRRAGEEDLPDVRLLGVEVLTADRTLRAPRLVRVTAEIASALPVQPFQFSVRLREGRNVVRLEALLEDRPDLAAEERSDTATVTVVYRPEMLPVLEEGTPLQLSDGSRLLVEIPPSAVRESLRSLEILPVEPQEVAPDTYRRLRQVPEGAEPLFAYRFQGHYQIPFRAEASASLPGQPPSLAVDGRKEPPSAWVSSLVPFPIRWRVDLQAVFPLGRIVLYAHREGGVSFAPARAKIYVSTDGETFELAAEVAEFQDETTSIFLPGGPLARWVELVIEEGKQPNVVQVLEIEFYQPNGRRIVAEEVRPILAFERPVRVALRIEAERLAEVPPGGGVGLFLWNPAAREWEPLAVESGGLEGRSEVLLEGESSVLGPLAVFPLQSVGLVGPPLTAQWSLRGFSPNGDGIADRNRLHVAIAAQEWTPELAIFLFDLHGRRVRTLMDRQAVFTSTLTVEWDGTDGSGRPVPIGVYLYQVELYRPDRGQPEAVVNGVVGVAR